jgi:plasmid stabilization system protein ParE
MPAVAWTKKALADIDRHVNFLGEKNPEAAQKAAHQIRMAGDSLENNPRRAPVIQAAIGLRKLNVAFGKYGFVIHYAILDEEVVILRVYHGRENRLN